ncbi:MAG TPA: T9SS type A sorting domain-containing protein, partial [Cyclobacteriaceae bacterium]|nr:T9SS type A sorting domain-containing protein [Cyclobacteriaceae bacterium]
QELIFSYENGKKYRMLYYELTALDGKIVLSGQHSAAPGEGVLHLPVSQFAAGVYLFTVKGDEVRVEEKIMKL